MCGIAGILSLKDEKIFEKDIRIMNKAVIHRGPDAEGYFFEDNLALAHRRLSIIDLSQNANQPFFYKDRYVLVFNGEIYNYLEIKKKLSLLGYDFQTNSDSEVLIKAYAHWGSDAQNMFNGMWAFAIWDRKKKELFCSRDRFGIKPFYWGLKSNNFYFGSEIKQLRAIGIGKKCNKKEISIYIYTGCTNSSNESFYDGIYSLDKGHSLLIKKNGSRIIDRWYSLKNKIYLSKKNADPEELYSILNSSLQLRLRSDVNVGTALSGGIDSSSLVSLAVRNYQKMINDGEFIAIHAKSTDPLVDESSFAIEAVKKSLCNLNLVEPKFYDFNNSIKEIIFYQDEPFASQNIFMQYFVMNRAKELDCKVMLDGQGADEIFLGYSRLIFPYFFYLLRKEGIFKFLKESNQYIKNNYEINIYSFLKYFFGYPCGSLRSRYMRKRMQCINLSIDPVRKLYGEIARTKDNLDDAQILEIEKITLPQLLRTEDRNSMANSIEARIPFLDYRLVEYCLNLKPESKIKEGWTKYPLRNLNLIDKNLAWRKSKYGYDAPQSEWSQKLSKEMLSKITNSEFMKSIADLKKIRDGWFKMNSNEKWRLFNLSVWQEVHKVDF
tara:strand:- start:819 stop:2636 length:1818 start_codon:yes stop_codon:yes gene_type:complete